MINKIKLEKTENNRISVWIGNIDRNKITYLWGIQNGKMQELINEIKVGKNLGKKNETSPSEQALNELRSTINKKIQNGYKIISTSGILDDLELDSERLIPKPMLAHEFNEHKKKIKDDEIVYLQEKFDGLRCLANLNTGELYSRKGKQFFGLKHIEVNVKEFGNHLKGEWVDGELYSHSLTFQEISSLTRKTINTGHDSSAIKLMVYDFISTDKYSQRLDALQTAYGESDAPALLLAPSEAVQWPCTQAIEAAHDKFVEDGYEGLILRRDTPYQNKRTDSLLKYKKFFEEEFKIIGIEKEEHEDTVGTFTLVAKNGMTFNARPAMTDNERKYIWKNREKFDYSQVAGVKYQELTEGVQGIPRFPVLIKLRNINDCN